MDCLIVRLGLDENGPYHEVARGKVVALFRSGA